MIKKIRPVPATDAELLPALQMLAYYEVNKAKGPGEWNIALAPLSPGQTQPDVNRSRFDQNLHVSGCVGQAHSDQHPHRRGTHV